MPKKSAGTPKKPAVISITLDADILEEADKRRERLPYRVSRSAFIEALLKRDVEEQEQRENHSSGAYILNEPKDSTSRNEPPKGSSRKQGKKVA